MANKKTPALGALLDETPGTRAKRTEPTVKSEAMDKRPPSRQGAKVLQVFMPEADHRHIKGTAYTMGMTVDQFVKVALNMYLEANGKPTIQTK